MQDMAAQLNSLAAGQQQVAQSLARAAEVAPTPDAKRQLTTQQQSQLDHVRQLADEPFIQANARLNGLLDQAVDSIERSVQQTSQSDFDNAGQAASQAAESLKSAAQSAQQRADELKDQVAEQQMFDLRSLLSTAIKRQEPVVSELTSRLKDKKSDSTTMDKSSVKLQEWLATEQQLQQLLAQGRQRLESLDAFDWLLDNATMNCCEPSLRWNDSELDQKLWPVPKRLWT